MNRELKLNHASESQRDRWGLDEQNVAIKRGGGGS